MPSFLLIAFFLGFQYAALADSNPPKEARINTGYYYNSISENANRTDIEISLNFWSKDLFGLQAAKHNFNISSSNAFLFDRIEDMRKAFDRGELDMIIAPPLLISRYFNRQDLADGFVGVLAEKKQEAVLLIARADNNIGQIKDLRGKRLEMDENDPMTEVFLDMLVLKAMQKSYKNINLSVQHQKKSDRIVLDVFFNKTDSGIVYSSSYWIMVELNPDIINKVKILSEYPIKARNFSYFRRDYPLVKELTDAAMTFPQLPRGKQLLEIFKTPNIDYCKVEELEHFDRLYKEYLQLKKHEIR